MNTWDEVLDALSTHEKVCSEARILFDKSEMALGCMLLRDALRSEKGFMNSAPFTAICTNPALTLYLWGKEYVDWKTKEEKRYAEMKIATENRLAALRLTANTKTATEL